ATVKATLGAFGRIYILINNAGMSHLRRPMLEVDEAEFDRIMAVNVKSIFLFAHAVVPQMRRQKSGIIINIGSTAGIRPRPGLTWYNASKGAVNLMSKSMAVELAPDGIRVCAVAPVAGETPLLPSFMGGDSEELRPGRSDEAERTGAVVDLHDAEVARLEILSEALDPLFADVPPHIDLFDRGISRGENPRLWIDSIAHVAMGRDKRSYRLLQD